MDPRYPINPQVLNDIINNLSAVSQEARNFTASGRPIPNPSTSRAMMPRVILESDVGGGMARGLFAQDTLGRIYGNELMSPTVSQVQKELGKARVDKLLSGINLDLPNLGPLPEDMVPRRTMLERVSAAMPKGLLTALDLLTYSPELNANEQQELERRRKMPPEITK